MNFVFISPQFPQIFWNFCDRLKKNGINVLGIGDTPYDNLSQNVKDSLTEYYWLPTLEDYDGVFRAVAFYSFKYGKIDGLESNNEYWLEQDARLREDFNIPGMRPKELSVIKHKSGMKNFYAKAQGPCARFHLVTDLAESLAFIQNVGYPVIVKPDNGVGAVDTHKISNEDELRHFHETVSGHVQYIMEEFVPGDIYSYDAIIDSKGQPLLETGNHTMESIMDTVNNLSSSVFYIEKQIKEDLREAGRRCVAAFGVKSRFIHFEFFRLTQDHAYLGKKGTVVALEVNLRPSGGFTPDMINFAHSTNVYKIWADMVAFDRSKMPVGEHRFCACVGRRDGKHFRYSHEELAKRYAAQMCMMERLPAALAEAMGDQLFLAVFDTQEELDAFYRDAVECV